MQSMVKFNLLLELSGRQNLQREMAFNQTSVFRMVSIATKKQ